MRRWLRWLAWAFGAVIVLAAAFGLWAYVSAMRAYDRRWTPHVQSFAVPFPLDADDRAALARERVAAGAPPADPLAGVDLDAAARARAIARGRHLVESRVGCNGCHGADFGGRVLIDSVFIGYWAAPNLTTGRGSVTRNFAAADWDHAVRHGLRHDLRTSSMPVQDFRNLSDHELSDIVSYIRSAPPVDREIAPVRLGPLFSIIVATDRDTNLVAYTIDQQKPHDAEPPPAASTITFGQHIAQVCTGCHGPTFSGGKVQGDPSMPVVANLTPDPTGLAGWTQADFFHALRDGVRKDGTSIAPAMPWKTYGQMSDVELEALWAYLRTLPPREKGHH